MVTRAVDGDGHQLLLQVADRGSTGGSLTNAAPAATGRVTLNSREPFGSYSISLASAFEDVDSALSYILVTNDNPQLFSELRIDQGAASLDFTLAPGVNGLAHVVLRATDEQGAWAEARLTLNSMALYDVPAIRSLVGTQISENHWEFTGKVSESEDGYDGWKIHFSGLLDGQEAEVDENGCFRVDVQLPSDVAGEVSATVTDDHGVESDPFVIYIASWLSDE
jgi:hypothetical protein